MNSRLKMRTFVASSFAAAMLAACGGGDTQPEESELLSSESVRVETHAASSPRIELSDGKLAWSEADPDDLVALEPSHVGKLDAENCVMYIKRFRLPGSSRAGLIEETWGGYGNHVATRLTASRSAGLRTGTVPRAGAIGHYYLAASDCGGIACTHSLVIERVRVVFTSSSTVEYRVDVSEANYDFERIVGTRASLRLRATSGAEQVVDDKGRSWHFTYTPDHRESSLDAQANDVITTWLEGGLLAPDGLSSSRRKALVQALRVVQTPSQLSAWEAAVRAVVKNRGTTIRHEIATGLLPAAAAGESSPRLQARIDDAVSRSPAPSVSATPPATSAPTFASVTSPSTVKRGESFSVRVKVADRDGNLRSVAIRWSDGRSGETRSADGATESETFTRSFRSTGVFTWTITVTDRSARTATKSGSIRVL